MIELFEQYGYYEERRTVKINDPIAVSILRKSPFHTRFLTRKGKEELCYRIDCIEDVIIDNFHFQSSYFIGIDWLVENELSIYIKPKINRENIEIDYIGILLKAISETENLKHLDDLLYIDFSKPHIEITQKQDLLSPFLIAQFLEIVKRIVIKGLKKSYYPVTENLNSRIKGKIRISSNIKTNLIRGKQTHTVCQYQEYGLNCDENKILKKAYLFSRRVIQQYKGIDTQSLSHLLDYIHPAFESVSDNIDISKVKAFRSNPMFKEYDQAIKLALLILKRYSYNITQTEQEKIATPPFWIDMSKLFELYVFKKLKEVFQKKEEVQYHVKAKHQELDFLLKSEEKNYLFVIDTKYKPKYHNKSIHIDDIRQLSGYARLEKVYNKLSISNYNKNLNCLIIYAHQDCDETFELKHFNLDEIENDNIKTIRKEKGYTNFYKLGIKLPEIEKN